jgi:hypothetical protein
MFITNTINLDKALATEALNNQVKRLKNPPKTTTEVLETLESCGLVKTAEILRRLV